MPDARDEAANPSGAAEGETLVVNQQKAEAIGSSPKLWLFDIDGTIIASGGAGERALRAAVLERFGNEEGMRGVEIAGRTDSGIAQQVLRHYRVEDTHESRASFLECYLAHLTEMLPKTPGRLLPGVVPLLEALQAREDVVLGLLTGNLVRGAELKLRQYGVWQFFGLGAYADDHHDRNELGPFALKRVLEQHGLEIPGERTFVIGDTPHDIACGRAFGAKTVAVATGIFSSEALAACRPDHLFQDLSDTAAVLAIQ